MACAIFGIQSHQKQHKRGQACFSQQRKEFPRTGLLRKNCTTATAYSYHLQEQSRNLGLSEGTTASSPSVCGKTLKRSCGSISFATTQKGSFQRLEKLTCCVTCDSEVVFVLFCFLHWIPFSASCVFLQGWPPISLDHAKKCKAICHNLGNE